MVLLSIHVPTDKRAMRVFETIREEIRKWDNVMGLLTWIMLVFGTIGEKIRKMRKIVKDYRHERFYCALSKGRSDRGR